MVTNRVEILMGRRQVNRLLHDEGIVISFSRQPKLQVAGGGWRLGAPVDVVPQLVALIPFKRRMSEVLVNTELGNIENLPYVLIGTHLLNIERDDRFAWDGDEYQVKSVDPKNQDIRIAAIVDYFGASNG